LHRDIESSDDLFDTLAEVFLLDERALERARLDALWSHLATGHEAWVAAGRP